jgi:protease IV
MNIIKKYCCVLSLFVMCFGLQADSGISKRFVPAAQTAATVGNSALWHNPAGLAFMDGGESAINYLYEWNETGNRHHGGVNVAVNFWRAISLGVGVNTQAAFADNAKTKLGTDLNGILGSAIKLSNNTSFGVSFLKSHSFLHQKSSPTLVSFGTQIRPWSFLAVGGHYEEVQEGFFSAPNMTFGLSFRPHKERLTVGIDSKWVAQGKAWDDGFKIHPSLSVTTLLGGYGASVSAEIPGIKDGWSKPIFALSVDVNLAHLGLSFNGLINTKTSNFGMGGSIRTSSVEWPSVVDPSGLWVELTVEGDGIFEQKPVTFAERLFTAEQSPLSVLALLKRMESDRMIEGILLNFNGFSFGDGKSQEWREAIASLRAAGKTVVVYLDSPSERDYYIATAANQIFMNKESTLSLRSFQATLVYFADLLQKIGIKADAVVAGTYKTAPRQWTHARPQKEEIEVMSNILNNFYDQLLTDTAKSRNIDRDKLKVLFDRGELTANDAKESGLVDQVVFAADVGKTLDNQGDYAKVFFPGYEHRSFKLESWHEPKKIVVIPITHTIVDGHASPGLFSSLFPKTHAKDVVDEIDSAVKDPNVLGLIIRVDSPGGDALAGSRITQALREAQKSKPVVTSMSDVAASAGYMVAAGTSHILAMPNTITGSIGVFSLMFSGEKLSEKIGVFSKELSPLKNPGPTAFRPITKAEKKEAQHVIDWYYQNFIQTVSTGLDLDEATVRKHAEGHVWLGSEALEKKLVHELGGFSKAVDSVLLLADVPKDENVTLEIKKPGFSDQFSLGTRLMSLFKHDQIDVDMSHLATMAKPYVKVFEAYRLQGQPQARLPFDVEWRRRH